MGCCSSKSDQVDHRAQQQHHDAAAGVKNQPILPASQQVDLPTSQGIVHDAAVTLEVMGRESVHDEPERESFDQHDDDDVRGRGPVNRSGGPVGPQAINVVEQEPAQVVWIDNQKSGSDVLLDDHHQSDQKDGDLQHAPSAFWLSLNDNQREDCSELVASKSTAAGGPYSSNNTKKNHSESQYSARHSIQMVTATSPNDAANRRRHSHTSHQHKKRPTRAIPEGAGVELPNGLQRKVLRVSNKADVVVQGRQQDALAFATATDSADSALISTSANASCTTACDNSRPHPTIAMCNNNHSGATRANKLVDPDQMPINSMYHRVHLVQVAQETHRREEALRQEREARAREIEEFKQTTTNQDRGARRISVSPEYLHVVKT